MWPHATPQAFSADALLASSAAASGAGPAVMPPQSIPTADPALQHQPPQAQQGQPPPQSQPQQQHQPPPQLRPQQSFQPQQPQVHQQVGGGASQAAQQSQAQPPAQQPPQQLQHSFEHQAQMAAAVGQYPGIPFSPSPMGGAPAQLPGYAQHMSGYGQQQFPLQQSPHGLVQQQQQQHQQQQHLHQAVPPHQQQQGGGMAGVHVDGGGAELKEGSMDDILNFFLKDGNAAE